MLSRAEQCKLGGPDSKVRDADGTVGSNVAIDLDKIIFIR